MKKLKVILLLIICFMMSGCSVEYTLNIDENLNFTENVSLYENKEYFGYLNQTVDEYVELNKKYYEDNDTYKGFTYKILENDNSVKLDAKKKKMTIEDFNNNSIVFNTLFSQIIAEKNGNELKIRTTDYNGETFFRESFTLRDISYDKADFTIKSPLKLIGTNADVIDEKRGEYTWHFSRNKEGKNIELVLNTNVSLTTRLLGLLKRFWYIPVIIIVVGFIVIRTIFLYRNANKI